MQPQSSNDYKQLLTEVIKKQIVILGPDITLSKARNVKGLTVANDGTVTEVTGAPQEVIQALIDQFVQLSGLIVKKTMEPLLLLNAQQTPQVEAAQTNPVIPVAQSVPQPMPTTPTPSSVISAPSPVPSVSQQDPALQAVVDQALAQPTQAAPTQPAAATPSVPSVSPVQSVSSEVKPATNPLAA